MNKRVSAFIGLSVISMAFTAARYSTNAPSQKSSDIRSQFLGTWKLVSTEEKLKDGTVRPYKDVGPHGVGYLLYTADGHMCGELMNPDRPKWDDPPTAAQKIAAIDGLAAYCGRFEIDEVNHIMWHYPELAWTPNYVGTKQARPYRLESDRLVFSGKSTGNDPEVSQWTIVWEKVK
jgi:Lipocalin-like domain